MQTVLPLTSLVRVMRVPGDYKMTFSLLVLSTVQKIALSFILNWSCRGRGRPEIANFYVLHVIHRQRLNVFANWIFCVMSVS